MGRYILRRLVVSIPLLVFISIITFAVALMMPGDYIVATRPIGQAQSTTRQTYDHLRELYGLNRSPVEQYVTWMGEVFKGTLGYSLYYGVSVREVVGLRLLRTLELTVSGLVFGLLAGLIFGLLSALKQGSWLDNIITFVTFIWISVPVFVMALLLIYFFSLKLPIFPTGGRGLNFEGGATSLRTHLHHLVLPALVLGLTHAATFIRYVRNSVLETLQQDYVRTARAKGLPERRVILTHALRNALIPIITIIALSLPGLFGGAILVESVFNWPGIGLMIGQAVSQRDFPVVVGINLIIAALVLLSNLLSDVLYSVVDPRIHYE